MPTQFVLDVTPSVLDKAARAKKRGKATEMQVALNDMESELEDFLTFREPEGISDKVCDYPPIVQDLWLDEGNELHVVAYVPADFIISVSDLSEPLKRILDRLKRLNA
jgi:hypothetical protein